MNSSILTEKFAPALERACKSDAGLKKACGKVESIFEAYAGERKIKYAELRVIDFCDRHGEIKPPLIHFIASTPRPPKRTEQRHRRYITEQTSIVRRLIRAVVGLRPKGGRRVLGRPELALLEQVPGYMGPVLEKLPKARVRINLTGGKRGPIDDLSERGQLLLLALCRVDRDFNVSRGECPLKSLLLDHFQDVKNEVRSLTLSAVERESVDRNFYELLTRLDMRVGHRTAAAVKLEDWPQPLQGQFHRLKQLATGKISPEPALLDSAAEHKFPLEQYSPESIDIIQDAISQALAVFQDVETLGVEDLIRLQRTEVITGEGVKVEDRNIKTDQFRDTERAKITDCKRAHYDSGIFKSYVFGVKAIAARNGYVHLIEPFNQAYRPHTDLETKQARKDEKKLGISRRWLDEELDRLGVEFDHIVKTRSFVRSPRRRKGEADRAMRLCLFYPEVLTQRMLGYRQQAIRKAIEGKNIIFLADGTVILSFEKKEVKNKRALRFEIKPKEGGTHERLRVVLIAYKEKVLPYIRKHVKGNLGRYFFAVTAGHYGEFRAFSDHRDYGCFFKRRVREFLNVEVLEPSVRDALHSHFLRGVCADWMLTDLHMSAADVAEVLGDTVEVIMREYIDRNRVCDATPIFDRVNATRPAKDATNSGSNGEVVPKEIIRLLKNKEREIEALTDAFSQEKQQLNEKILDLEARLAQSEAAKAVTVSAW